MTLHVDGGYNGVEWGTCGMRRRSATRWVCAAALAAVATAAGPVGAFYWYGPPEKTIINPPDQGNPGNPPSEKHKHKHKQPDGPPTVPPDGPPEGPPPVEPTPEPTAIFGALIGLGTLAVRRAVRKR